MFYETGDREGLKALGYERFGPIAKFLGDKKPFIVGEYPTFPDFFIYENIELFDFICDQGGLIKRYPNLEGYRERIKALPGVKEFIASDKHI